MIDRLFKVLVSVFCCVWLAKFVLVPVTAYYFFKDDYMALASECANAMDESWFVDQSGSEKLEQSSRIHLLRCHEYDKLRKKMMIMGLGENVLAYLGLKALEVNQRTAEEFVEQHRFERR